MVPPDSLTDSSPPANGEEHSPSDDPRTHFTRPHPDRMSRMTLRPRPPGGEERIPMRPGTVARFAQALPALLWLVLLPSRCGAGP
jgi:hypothetical protein